MTSNILDNVPSGEPAALVCGDAWRWKRSDLTAFPAPGYTLSYTARLATDPTKTFTIDMAAIGDDWTASKASSAPGSQTAGLYNWELYATRVADSERITVDAGAFRLLPNLASDATDRRTHDEKMLSAIDALLEGKAGHDVASYTIGDRQLTKLTLAELMTAQQTYRARVVNARAAANGKSGRRRSHVSFGVTRGAYPFPFKPR